MDVCIRDVSSRGMMLQANEPPDRGTYVEITTPAQMLAGRVVWRDGRRFGVHIREKVAVHALTGQAQAPAAGAVQRTQRHRQTATAATAGALARANGKMLEFGSLVVTGLAMVAVAGALVQQTLGETVQAIMTHL